MSKSIFIATGVAAVITIIGWWAVLDGGSPVTQKITTAGQSSPSGRIPAGAGGNTRIRSAAAAPEEAETLLNQLAGLSVPEGNTRATRSMLVLLEQLTRTGSRALPAIRQFLASGQDVPYTAPGGKRLRDVKSLVNALVPPSLRTALFETVSGTGGKEAEAILAENLSRTGSGLEVAYLSELLQHMKPGNYKNAVVAAATRLLEQGAAADRNILFEVMRGLGDTSYIAAAQRQMFQADGQLDRSALRYLQQAMGPQSIALAARMYQDPRLVEPGSKEPLARMALTYVGADPQALELFHTALLDPALLPDQKRNLVEDLNEDGLSSKKSPTPDDLRLIAKRYELTQAYLQEDYVLNDRILNAAFLEADKDLRGMLEKAANPPQ